MGASLNCQSVDEDFYPHSVRLSTLDNFSNYENSQVFKKDVSIPVAFTPSARTRISKPQKQKARLSGVKALMKRLSSYIVRTKSRIERSATEQKLRASFSRKLQSKRSSLPMQLLQKDLMVFLSSQSLVPVSDAEDYFETPRNCRKLPSNLKVDMSSIHRVIYGRQTSDQFLATPEVARNQTPQFECLKRWPSTLEEEDQRRDSGSSVEDFAAICQLLGQVMRRNTDSAYLTPKPVAPTTPMFSQHMEDFVNTDKRRQSSILKSLEAQFVTSRASTSSVRTSTSSFSEPVSRIPCRVSVSAPKRMPGGRTPSFGGSSFSDDTPVASNSTDIESQIFDLAEKARLLACMHEGSPELEKFASEMAQLTQKFEKLMKFGPEKKQSE